MRESWCEVRRRTTGAVLSRPLAVCVALALLLVAAPSGAKKKDLPFTIVPAVGERTQVGPGVEEVRVHRQGLTAAFSYVTGAARRRMMESTLGLGTDPFATPPGVPTRFHTFLVYLENTSDRELHVNPSVSRILTDRGKFSYALDYTALYQMLQRGLTLDQIRKVAYDRPFTLGPAGRTKKLLVFKEIPGDKWREFSVIFTLETDGLLAFEVPARFRKLYLEGPP